MSVIFDKNKESFLIIFILITSVCLLFYWTHLAFNKKYLSILKETQVYKEKIKKVKKLSLKLKNNNFSTKKVSSGLLSFYQIQTRNIGLENKLVVIKPKITDSGSETVVVRYEKLNFNELMSVIKITDSYSNLNIKSFEISKRFDNPKLIDLNMEIMRSKY
jgi:hypothetical protein